MTAVSIALMQATLTDRGECGDDRLLQRQFGIVASGGVSAQTHDCT
jgi:hypothetical protein